MVPALDPPRDVTHGRHATRDVRTRDGSLSVHDEHTLVITRGQAELLTA
jgi:methionine aminopeptidase